MTSTTVAATNSTETEQPNEQEEQPFDLWNAVFGGVSSSSSHPEPKAPTTSKRLSLTVSPGTFRVKCDDEAALLDRYDLGDVLYEGDFCHVQACQHKLISSNGNNNNNNNDLYDRVVKIVREHAPECHEYNLLKKIDSPDVPMVYQLYSREYEYYMIMERCFGNNLQDELKERTGGVLPEAVAKQVLWQLLSCLNYLHHTSVSIVHTDIRPQNILLKQPHEFGSIQLIDFDTAVQLDQEDDSITQRPRRECRKNVTDTVYQAPEIHYHHPHYDAKVDLWSCGVLLYRMLFNKLPFCKRDTDTEHDIVRRMRDGHKLRFPHEEYQGYQEWCTVSDNAKDLIRQLLSTKPKHRPNARQALQHKWFADLHQQERSLSCRSTDSTDSDYIQTSMLLSNVRKHNPDTVLKRAVCALVVAQLMTQDEKETINRVFDQLDILHNGTLQRHEVQAAYLSAFDMLLSDQELNDIFRRVDTRGNNTLHYSEFAVAALGNDLMQPERLRQAFDLLSQQKGYITKDELKAIPAFSELSNEDLKCIICDADPNGDQRISYDEFETFMTKSVLH